jgi:hypothetical protein
MDLEMGEEREISWTSGGCKCRINEAKRMKGNVGIGAETWNCTAVGLDL